MTWYDVILVPVRQQPFMCGPTMVVDGVHHGVFECVGAVCVVRGYNVF